MKRILLIIIPALLLAALILLNRTTTSWRHPIITGAPGEVLYVATFDGDATDAFNRDWDQFGGRLSSEITSNAIQITLDEYEAGTYSVADAYFADFDITVQAQAVAGPEDNGFGIVFRLQDQDNDNPGDDSYYLFLISSDGYYQVVRVIEGQDRELSTWIESPSVQTGIGAANTLRVRAQGDSFEFFVNGDRLQLCVPNNPEAISTYFLDTCVDGAMVDALTDATIPNGRLGVGARSFSTASGVVVTFDDLVVIAPQPEDLPNEVA